MAWAATAFLLSTVSTRDHIQLSLCNKPPSIGCTTISNMIIVSSALLCVLPLIMYSVAY